MCCCCRSMVSSNIEAWTALTPVKVSLPVEASPESVPVPGVAPVCMSTVTPPVALTKARRVLPLPMMVSLPPPPLNSLKVPFEPALALAPEKPAAL